MQINMLYGIYFYKLPEFITENDDFLDKCFASVENRLIFVEKNETTR